MRTKILALTILLSLTGAVVVSCSDSTDDNGVDAGPIGNRDGGIADTAAPKLDAATDTAVVPPTDGGGDAGPTAACVIPATHVAIINNPCPAKDTFVTKVVTLPDGKKVGDMLPAL